jgi:hypothetical protein
VVDEQFAKETQILAIQLRLGTIHFPDRVAAPLVHLSSWWLEHFTARLMGQKSPFQLPTV